MGNLLASSQNRKVVIAAAVGLAVVLAIVLQATVFAGPSALEIVKERLRSAPCTAMTQEMQKQGYTAQIDGAYAADNSVIKVPVSDGFGPFGDEPEAVFSVDQNGGDWIVSAEDQQTYSWFFGCMGANSVVEGNH